MQSNFSSNGTRTMKKPIRIAIQQKGRLREGSIAFLQSMGLRCAFENEREYIVPCEGGRVEILCVRNGDIPKYIEFGAADYGIVGENILHEHEQDADVTIAKKLGFGSCRVVIAVPNGSSIRRVSDLQGERIATSYPNTLKKFLMKHRIDASIIEIQGKVEVTPRLGLADAICEIVQTGRTLEENNLIEIEKILNSQAVLIQSPSIMRQSIFDTLL